MQALKEFFSNVTADSGMAYVVILHLSPDHDSKLAEVLQLVSPIPVTQVSKRVTVMPNHVYVVPPNKHLTMVDGDIAVSPNITTEERRAPVDIFFRTLAESHQSRAVAVILSGTGANGSMGLKRVKERGGVCFVQNPRQAEFSEMPRNSIATDLVDRILNVAEIPAQITEYKKSLGKVEISDDPQSRPESQQMALREIFTQLRIRTGHDFSNYKRATILRRIERRINVQNLPDLPAYTAFIRENIEETTALLKDLLISVTNFFRDPAAFNFLELDILPRLFSGKTAEDQVRIWISGCATGEEAYSLAMLCAEYTIGLIDAPKVQIFATDIDEHAIASARNGFYTLNDAADVSPERLGRFFTKEADGFRIRRELREMVLFANHNVLKDPPFSRVDLITCRNLLIYLNHAAQERVMEIFHFALNAESYLFLGNSETVDGAGDLYSPISREFNLYQSRQISNRIGYPVAETSLRSFRIEPSNTSSNLVENERKIRNREKISPAELHLQLLEQYTPSILVNADYDIIHSSESATKFLQFKGGEPTRNLLKLIHPRIRIEIRTALYQAVEQKTNVEIKNLNAIFGKYTEAVNIYIRPIIEERNSANGFILILFEKATNDKSEVGLTTYSSAEPAAGQLEAELISSKTRLGSLVEQYEVQTEELKASNEELQAINEELRSATEELETSHEELESVNEELVTVNQELKIKIEELSTSNDDFLNLINSTEIATIFLDRSLRVNSFTPAANRIFNLISADCGRPISDLSNNLENDNLTQIAQNVLETLQTQESEIRAENGRVYLQRVLPYRTTEDRINGVVITFTDITEQKRAEETKSFLASIVESSEDAIISKNLYGIVTSWNKSAERIFGYQAHEIIGKPIDILIPPQFSSDEPEILNKIRNGISLENFETVRQRKDGSLIDISLTNSPIRDSNGKIVGASKIAREITARKKAEEALRESEQRFQFASAAAQSVIYDWNIITDHVNRSGELLNLLGFDPNDETTQTNKWFCSRLHPEDESQAKKTVKKALKKGDERFEDEFRLLHRDGFYVWVNDTGIFLRNEKGDAVRCVGSITNITKRKEAEGILERYRLISERARDIIWLLEPNGKIIEINQAAVETYGYTREELLGKNIADLRAPSSLSMLAEHIRLATEGYTKFETVHVRKDGSELPVEVSASSSNFGDKRYILGIVRDVTERRKSEAALLKSETRLRLALEASEMATWSWHLTTDEVFWNDQHFLLFGIDPRPNPVTSADFFNHVHPDDRQPLSKLLQKAIAERSVFDAEFRSVLESGEIRWMSGFGRVVEESASGEPLQMSGVMFDITDRKLSEEKVRISEKHLRESEERLRLLIESAKDYAIFTMSKDGIINSWNMGAEKIFGWTEAEAIGQSCKIIFTPEDLQKGEDLKEMKTALRKGRAPDERFHIRKNGTRFYVSGVMTLLKDVTGKASGFVKIARDMSERIKAEKALRDKELLQKLVSALEDERRRIARDLHDELGQQLTALRLKLEKTRRMCEDEPICEEIENIELIAKSIDNGVDFLAWELRPATLDQFGLISALENYIHQWTLHSGVPAELLTSSLKKRRFAREVETNLYRIVQEALNNVHKHAQSSRAEVLLEKRGDLIVLIIQDDGKGFNVKDKKTRSKGIGLIGMQERAELINGTFEVESSLGNGTTIFVRVPASTIKKGGSDG